MLYSARWTSALLYIMERIPIAYKSVKQVSKKDRFWKYEYGEGYSIGRSPQVNKTSEKFHVNLVLRFSIP